MAKSKQSGKPRTRSLKQLAKTIRNRKFGSSRALSGEEHVRRACMIRPFDVYRACVSGGVPVFMQNGMPAYEFGGGSRNLILQTDEARVIELFSAEHIGEFYIIQLFEDDDGLVKLGHSKRLQGRVRDFMVTCPDCFVVYSRACPKRWECAAMDHCTSFAEQIGNEVFRGDVGRMVRRAKHFFSMMPKH